MSYQINADNVLRGSVFRKRLRGFLFAVFILFTVELFFIYNYISYINSANLSGNGLVDFVQSLVFMTELPGYALGMSSAGKVITTFAELWWVQLIIVGVALFGVRSIGKFYGMEHGSANWADKKTRRNFRESDRTIPLQDGLYVKPQDKTFKNTNEMVVGDTGAFKTYRKIIPDIMQQLGSYIVTTTKSDLFTYGAKFIKQNGYKIRVLNLSEPKYSNTYNPFAYINSDTDIDKLVNTFLENSRKQDTGRGDQFWEDTMSMLMSSIVHYLHTSDDEIKTFARMTDLVNSFDVVNGEIAAHSEYEEKMNLLRQKNPFHPAVLNYGLFKKSAGDTLKSILISIASRLRFWTTEEIRILTSSDEIDIDSIAREKTVLFIMIPAGDNTYQCISSMLISQIFNRLYYLGDFVYKGRLPMVVNLELDEFPNIGKIPAFDTYVSTMRSYNLRTCVVVQNLMQLENLYGKASNTIISNCYIFNYLGCNDQDTHKKVSERLGKTTIKERNMSYNTGAKQGGGSESERLLARELMTPDEVGDIPDSHNIVFIGGLKFYGHKYRTENHPLSAMLGYENGNPNNTDIHAEYAELAALHSQRYKSYVDELIETTAQKKAEVDDMKSKLIQQDIEDGIQSMLGQDEDKKSEEDKTDSMAENLKKKNKGDE